MDSTNNSQQAMWVAIGQFFSFAIGIVSPMILSRYFNKSDYGTYKQVMYVYQTMLIVFTLGLPKAYSYFIPRVSLAESKDIVKKISRIFLLLGLLCSAFLFFISQSISNILNNHDLDLALKWFAPTPLFLLPVMGIDGILASYNRTQYLAIYTIITRVFTLLCILLPVVIFSGTYIHAIIGFDVASLLTFLLSIYIRNMPVKGIILEKTNITIKEIFSFSMPLLTASIWGMIIVSSDQFFISRYYGNEIFAEFSNGFVDFPIIPMVTGAVATILLPLFSGMLVHDKENVSKVWMSALTKSAKLIYPMTVYCIFFANLVMACLYGSRYENSGIYFCIKNVESFFVIIPFFPILLALGKSKEYSRVHMAMAFFIIAVEYAVVKLGGSAYMVGIASAVCVIIKVILLSCIVAMSLGMLLKDLIPFRKMIKIIAVSFIAIVLPLIAANIFKEMNKFLLLFVTSSAFVLCYYLLCWLFHLTYKDVLSGFIGGRKLNFLLKIIP